jgi:hypothetical protein
MDRRRNILRCCVRGYAAYGDGASAGGRERGAGCYESGGYTDGMVFCGLGVVGEHVDAVCWVGG